MNKLNNSVSCGVCAHPVNPLKQKIFIKGENSSTLRFSSALALSCKNPQNTDETVNHFFHNSCLIRAFRDQTGEFGCPSCGSLIDSVNVVKEINCHESGVDVTYHGQIRPLTQNSKGTLIVQEKKTGNLFDSIEFANKGPKSQGVYVGEVFCRVITSPEKVKKMYVGTA